MNTPLASRLAALALTLATATLAGCTDDPGTAGARSGPSTAAGSSATPSFPTSPTGEAAGAIDLRPISAGTALAPATYAVPLLGDESPARAVVDVPEGYFSAGGWVIDDGHDRLAPDEFGDVMFFGSAERVAPDPCRTRMVDPGAGVRALADALAAQQHRRTTTPRPVTVDGHRGLYLESRAAGSLAGCATGTHRLLATHPGDSFWLEDRLPGTTDHLWVLDVDGRLVVAVAQVVRGKTAHPKELVAIARSAGFRGVRGDQQPLVDGPRTSLAPATYRFSTGDGGDLPDALVDVPGGYDAEATWYVVSPDGQEFLGLLSPRLVTADPCRAGEAAGRDPGPSVRDLADALVAQRSTRATRPRPVTLDGHDGLYLELEGPAHLSRCPEPGDLFQGRGIYGDHQVDQLWIVDVAGTRMVVDAAHTDATPAGERAALARMARSVRFVAPVADQR